MQEGPVEEQLQLVQEGLPEEQLGRECSAEETGSITSDIVEEQEKKRERRMEEVGLHLVRLMS